MPLVQKVPIPAEFPQVPFIDNVVDLRVKSHGSKVHRTFEASRQVRAPLSALGSRVVVARVGVSVLSLQWIGCAAHHV